MSILEEGGLEKFQKRYKRGSDKPKMLQEEVLNRRGGSDVLHRFICGGLTKSENKYISFIESRAY